MDMGDYYSSESNPKKIKLEQNEGAESDDSWKCEPPSQTTWQNSIKLEQEPDPVLVSGYERRPSNETRLMNPLYSKNLQLTSKVANTHEPKLTGFNCHKCLLHFATPGEMTRHWTERHGLHPVHCPVCNDPFANNIDLWHHKMEIHGIPCELCDEFFETQELLVVHVKSVHLNDSSSDSNLNQEEREVNNSDNQEMISSVSHSLRGTFPEAQNTSSSSSGFKCHLCPQHFLTPDLLKHHWSDGHGLSPASCGVCKKPFPIMSEMSHHRRIAHGIPCKFCDKHYDTQHDLSRHIQSCHMITCHICGMGFKMTRLLNVHVANSHGERRPGLTFPFNCSVCGMVFISKTSFKKHRKDTLHGRQNNPKESGFIPPENRPQTSQGDFSWDDAEPGMPFASTSRNAANGLEMNPPTSHSEHSTNIPIPDSYNASLATFKCHLCPTVFGNGVELRAHWCNSHNLRAVHCIYCKEPFPSIPLMHAHKMAIHGMSCDICDKPFIKSVGLEAHMKDVHGRTKEYFCSFCGMRFTAEKDLKKHVVGSHSDVQGAIQKCDVCAYTCVTEEEMVRHKGKHWTCTCLVCGTVLNSKGASKRHRKETGHQMMTKY